MDLPLDLSTGFLVSGKDELYQDLLLVLKNQQLSFFSSYALGSSVSLHTDDTFVLSEQIKSTVQTIQGVSVSNIVVNENFDVFLQLQYNGLFTEFKFNLNELQV